MNNLGKDQSAYRKHKVYNRIIFISQVKKNIKKIHIMLSFWEKETYVILQLEVIILYVFMRTYKENLKGNEHG